MRGKHETDVPENVRGRLMETMADTYSTVLACPSHTRTRWLHAGCDSHSCTSTAAALAHWLNLPSARARTLSELSTLEGRVFLPQLSLDCNAVSLLLKSMGGASTLYVFYTPNHKFCVLRVGDQVALLHSNQDATSGGQRFTLQQHLTSDAAEPRTVEWLNMLILNLAAAAVGLTDHEAVCNMYFGASFRRGSKDDYWNGTARCAASRVALTE